MEHGPLSRRERGRLWTRLGIRGALVAAAVFLIRYAAPPLLSLAAPFLPALVVAWLLNRPVRWLQRRLGFSRKTVSLAVLLFILCLLGGAVYGLLRLALGQLRALAENWPDLVEDVRRLAVSLGDSLSRFLPSGLPAGGEELIARLADWLEGLDLVGRLTALAGKAPSVVSGLSGFAVSAVVFVMASCFITGDYPRLRFLLADRLSADTRRFCASVKNLFFSAFGGYFKSQLLLSLGVLAILAVGFFLTAQPYGLLLAAALAVLDFIPIVGSGTVLLPWAAVRLISGRWQGAVGLLAIWGITALFRRVAEPRILGSQTGLSPILSLAGIYGGMKLGGIPGMVLGPVILLVAVNLGRQGIFRPAAADLRLAARDVAELLREDRSE